MNSFSIKEAIKFGWTAAKSRLWFFVAILLISLAIQMFPNILSNLVKGDKLPAAFSLIVVLLSIAGGVAKLLIDLGSIKIALKIHDNQEVKVADLFSCREFILRYLGGYILYFGIILTGFLLLVIPGIIWAIRLQFFSYLVVDKGLGPVQALRQSWGMTRGQTWRLFIFMLLVVLINVGGALLLLVGLFLTIPTTMVATAFIYRRLIAGEQMISSRWIYILACLGIIAVIILPAVVVLMINPLELTRKSRDAVRLSDLANMSQLINQAQAIGKPLCSNNLTYCEGRSDKNDWAVSGISKLPVDPTNKDGFSYRYCSDGLGWEIETKLESQNLASKAVSDNGDNSDFYEVGSDLTTCK